MVVGERRAENAMSEPVFTTCKSTPHALSRWAKERPDDTACAFVGPGLMVERSVGYRDLERAARKLAMSLRETARPGDRVLLLFPPGVEYVTAVLGCMYAGVIAVPLYPPHRDARMDRVLSVIVDCEPAVALTTEMMTWLLDGPISDDGLGTMKVVTIEAAIRHAVQPIEFTDVVDDDIALLQYTSGSTGRPKGVMVDHRNIASNQTAIAEGFRLHNDDVILSWLPAYHDMGLIGTTLLPLRYGLKTFILNPLDFIHDALIWPLAMAKFQATCSGSPNFGYRLLCDKYDGPRMADVDLRCWRVAFNGAEPVDKSTMEHFAATYGRHGFNARALYPCYGLAEATLFVTGGTPDGDYRAGAFERGDLERKRLTVATSPGPATVTPARSNDNVALVSSGTPCRGTAVVVRGEDHRALPEGAIGEICVQGPGVARGYWADPQATSEVFRGKIAGYAGTFLRTGDLGALLGGDLYVTGRAKDLIIVGGRNFYPHDIESAAWLAAVALRKGCSAAFQLSDEQRRVVLVTEVRRESVSRLSEDPAALRDLGDAVHRQVVSACNLGLSDVVFVSPGSVPKTSSGKIRRGETRRRLLGNQLTIIGWWRAKQDDCDSESYPDHLAPRDLVAGHSELLVGRIVREAVIAHGGVKSEPAQFALPLAGLGFDSLNLVALKGTIERRLGARVDSSLFFGDRSPEEIIQSIGMSVTAEPTELDDRGTNTATTGNAGGWPMSDGQAQLQFYDQLFPEDVANNLPCALRFSRPLEEWRLRDAVAKVVEKHSALRTTLGVPGDRSQIVTSRTRFDWFFREFVSDEQEQIRQFLAEVAYRRFEFTDGPLVRAAAAVSPETTSFTFVCHHAVADYWSLRIIMTELVDEILCPRDLQKDEGPAATAIEWATARASAAPQAEARLASLAEKWRPLRNHTLLPPRRRVARLRNPAGTIDFDIETRVTKQLYERSKALNFTPFVSIAASYLFALHRLTGRPQIIIGVPHHGRTDSNFDRTVGYLVNVIPLLGDFRSQGTLLELEEQTWRELRTSLATADVPFSSLVRALAPERYGENPLFQATLTFQQSAGSRFKDGFAVPWSGCRELVGDVSLEVIDIPPRDVAFPVSMYGALDDSRLVFRVAYQQDMIERARALSLRDYFQTALLELAAQSTAADVKRERCP